MADTELPSPDLLRKLLDYDPSTGVFVWRKRDAEMFQDGRFSADAYCRAWNKRYAETLAGGSNSGGYVQIRVNHRLIKGHRIAWAMHYGSWPEGAIDHINHARGDNRIDNLRVVTRSENQKNQSRNSGNKSGVTGVRWREKYGHWVAKIGHNGRHFHLGAYRSFEDAVKARRDAESRFGFHVNHGN